MKKLLLFFLLTLNLCFSQDIEVSGAGTSDVNGVYAYAGDVNGKPFYQSGANQIIWNGYFWTIGDINMPSYYSWDDTNTPDMVSTWDTYYGSSPSPNVSIYGPSLSYTGSFIEDREANNGAITGAITITFNGFGGNTFTGTNGENFVSAGKVTVSNLPSGLTAVITRNSGTSLTFTLSGNAAAHTNANDINNLGIVFQNSAFTFSNANAISNYSKSFNVEFIQQYTVGTTGDFSTIASAIDAVQDYDVLLLAAQTFTESNIAINDKSITILGQSPSQTIIQANANPGIASSRIFTINFSSYSNANVVRFEKLTIRNGNATNYAGGFFSSNANIEIENCFFEKNYANTPVPDGYFGDGGGAFRVQDGSLTVLNSTFSGNRHNCVSNRPGDMMGGGAFSYFGQDAYNTLLRVENCTFTNNSTGNHGGALMLRPSNTAANRIVNCTFSENSAGNDGGALYFGGTGACQFSSTNSIYYGNTAGANVSVYSSFGSTFSFTNCLLQDNTNIGNMSATFTNCIINQNPLLSSLADNGGFTKTRPLQSGSVAINAGISTGLVPSTDQRGYNRVGSTDIGAYEFGAGNCTAPTITASTPASSCEASTVSISATPSAGIINWYDAATNGNLVGSGTTFTTPSISATTTYFAEAVDGSCVSTSRTAVEAKIENCTKIQTAQCGATILSSSTPVYADAVANATSYKFEFNDGTTITEYESATNSFTFNQFAYTNNTTYGVRVAAKVNGVYSMYGASCDVRMEFASKIQPSQCGATISSGSTTVWATSVPFATGYRFELTDESNNITYLDNSTRSFTFNQFASVNNTNYSVRVSPKTGSTYGAFTDACIVRYELATKIQSSQCGATITASNTLVYANTIPGATSYRFEITDPNNTVVVLTNSTRSFSFNQFAFTNGTTYSVRVAPSTGTTYSSYGTACSVRIEITTKVQASQCGTTITSGGNSVLADALAGATGYRFELTDPNNNVFTVTNSTRSFTFSQFASVNNTTYSVRASALIGGVYSNYGAACNVRYELTTKLQTSQCGTLIPSSNTAIYATSIAGATGYKFEITDPSNNVYVLDNTTRWFKLSQFASTPNTSYSVRVSVKTGNVYSAYGAACTITSPGVGLRPEGAVELKSMDEPTGEFEAYPNPSTGNFTLASTEVGMFNILNELGQLVRKVEITEASGYQVLVENLPNGAYFVTGTLNGEAVTKKVIVVR